MTHDHRKATYVSNVCVWHTSSPYTNIRTSVQASKRNSAMTSNLILPKTLNHPNTKCQKTHCAFSAAALSLWRCMASLKRVCMLVRDNTKLDATQLLKPTYLQSVQWVVISYVSKVVLHKKKSLRPTSRSTTGQRLWMNQEKSYDIYKRMIP